jgi:hypothetical protein
MNNIKKIGTTILMAMLTVFAHAQNVPISLEQRAERTQQSVYIVMAVVITIVSGLFLYLLTLDRKISKLEKGKL